MLAALEEQMPEGTTWTVPEGGFFIWMTLPEGLNCAEIATIAQQRGVGIGIGTMFYANGGGENKVRLSYSFNDDDQIREGVRTLADVMREQAG
jgi:2-aminoadipate transaminase